MPATKTLREREKELQALLAHPVGLGLILALETRYQGRGGKVRPPDMSVVTYILAHEKERGLISG